MIENRLIRFLVSLVTSIIFCIVLNSIADKVGLSDATNAVTIACVVAFSGLIYQLLCDVLNFEMLNEGFFLLVKRIIFVVLSILFIILSFAYAEKIKYLNSDTNKFGLMLCLMAFISASTLTAVYLITTSKDVDSELTHFFTPLAFIISFVVSLIFVLILKEPRKIYIFSNWYNGILSVLLIGYRTQIGGFCEEFGDGSGFSFGGSSSSSHSSSSNSSNYSSSYSGSSYSKTSDDSRDFDTGSAFESAMYSACRNIGWGLETAHGRAEIKITPHVYIGACTFDVDVYVSYKQGFDNYDKNKIASAVEDVRKRVFNNAKAEVKKLQQKYKNFDNGCNISVSKANYHD